MLRVEAAPAAHANVRRFNFRCFRAMQEQKLHTIQIENVVFECRVDASLMPGIKRVFTGTTPCDSEIDGLPFPQHPVWLSLAVGVLRWYRSMVAPRLGNRCVFEPSCSRYSELAFRKYGFLGGLTLTVRRLHRCRPGSGGIDMP